MQTYLIDELHAAEKRIKKLRDDSSDQEFRAMLNNVLQPVHSMIDEYEHDRQRGWEDMTCLVLQETRKRLEEITGADTMRSGDLTVEE
jgi:hypothetical protein